MTHNEYYKKFQVMQQDLLSRQASLNISSYDLFIVHTGIECAMLPVWYPTTAFSDTAIMEHYRATSDDEANRTVSIGLSWTRKVLSSVRVYAEQRDLPFFLYEKNNAGKFFSAHVRAKRMGVAADVLTRDSQTSTGYWEVQKDASSDVVRIMLDRCFDEDQYPLLYKHCRNLRGELWLAAFPNVFITIAPAEWRFPRPYFLDPYINCLFAGAYCLALHMYYLVRCILRLLCSKGGNRFFLCV